MCCDVMMITMVCDEVMMEINKQNIWLCDYVKFLLIIIINYTHGLITLDL